MLRQQRLKPRPKQLGQLVEVRGEGELGLKEGEQPGVHQIGADRAGIQWCPILFYSHHRLMITLSAKPSDPVSFAHPLRERKCLDLLLI